MRVLAHIHTFNDADIIDRTVDALQRQTRPVDEILIVDNASSDGTLERPSIKGVSVLRHAQNQGTSGAVCSGLRYALEHGYDWAWILDADSHPEPDALQKLLDLYAEWTRDVQENTGFLACLARGAGDGAPIHGQLFTSRGFHDVKPPTDTGPYRCHTTIWSGCLYRIEAVRLVGFPNPDYVLDCGEGEYGYRMMKAGFAGFIHQDAVLKHNVRGHMSTSRSEVRLGPLKLALFEFPPIRCYYICRNVLYFALYDFAEERLRYLRSISWWVYGFWPRFLLRPWSHRKHLAACLRGLWHGVTGNIAARY